ncbi:MAG: rhomboid family intramembrane serine protease [Dysgonamonadaceae bacterium]|nr:rhomboid family intramembrane serine protease [Dysgonamonadaceae bacterium]
MQRNTFLSHIPPVTKNILIINLILWLASTILLRTGISLDYILGLHYVESGTFKFYQPITYLFMHGSFSHIFFNMFAVFMFGRVLEETWGSKQFLIYYLITGIGAAVIQECVWFFTLPPLYYDFALTIGASGAVFGILLAFGMMFPNIPLYLMFIPIPIKAKYFVTGYGLIELFLGIASFSGDNVAHFAHLGGMLFGYFLIIYWKKKAKSHGNYFQ